MRKNQSNGRRRRDTSTWLDPQCGQIRCTAGKVHSTQMDFHIRSIGAPERLAILAGAFNPPTRAHLAMAEAALSVVDEVLFALPRVFPHKEYTGAGFETRLDLLRAAISGQPRFSLASTGRGLFVEIAREARSEYGLETELFLLCGRDAAERIVGWDYGEAGSIQKQLQIFELLVASRGGAYEAPPELRDRVRSIALPPGLEEISSSEVRRRIQAGEPWKHLVPGSIVRLIEERSDLW
jgi:nicotinate-nucleotide adenylyltransferase